MSRVSVTARVNRNVACRLAVSTSVAITSPTYSPSVDAVLGAAKLTVSGLAANTQYYCAVEVAGVIDMATIGKFKTPPAAIGTASSFKFAFSSCQNFDSNHVVFDRIRAQDPLFFMHLGDLHYGDYSPNRPGLFRGAFDRQLLPARPNQLFREVPTFYMFDDHDYGPNDSAGNSTSRDAALAAFRERVPHPPLVLNGVTDPVYYSFEIGRVLFIVTDLRSMASHESVTDNSAKTKMGAAQKTWFKNILSDPANSGKVFVWMSTSPWVPNVTAGEDHWGGYSTERTELADYIKIHCLNRIFVLSGDTHAVGLDDGTHGDWATGGGGPVREFTASPLDTSTGTWTATYTSGYILNTGQFGIVEITDTGTSTIGVTWTAMKADGTVLYTMSFNCTV